MGNVRHGRPTDKPTGNVLPPPFDPSAPPPPSGFASSLLSPSLCGLPTRCVLLHVVRSRRPLRQQTSPPPISIRPSESSQTALMREGIVAARIGAAENEKSMKRHVAESTHWFGYRCLESSANSSGSTL